MRFYWPLICLNLLLIHPTAQAWSGNPAQWEPVTLHQAPDAPAFPEALPDQVLDFPLADSQYGIHQLYPGLTFSQARTALKESFPDIRELTTPPLEQRWQRQSQFNGNQIRTSYRLIANKNSPERISELQANWFSSTLPRALLHRKLIQLLTAQSGPVMSWKQAQTAHIRTVQRAHKWASARLQKTSRDSQQQPALRTLIRHQQFRVFQLGKQLAQAGTDTRIAAATLCSALNFDTRKYCHLRGTAQADTNNQLISTPGSCHYWLQDNGDMMSACIVTGGVQLRITSPETDRHYQHNRHGKQQVHLKL